MDVVTSLVPDLFTIHILTCQVACLGDLSAIAMNDRRPTKRAVVGDYNYLCPHANMGQNPVTHIVNLTSVDPLGQCGFSENFSVNSIDFNGPTLAVACYTKVNQKLKRPV